MWLLAGGLLVFVVTAALFVRCLPRNGKYHRYVGTELEPYVAVCFTAGIALSFAAVLSAILEMIG
jgi:hypothetical protein